jgi:coiled-coil domain-containing protein 63/114
MDQTQERDGATGSSNDYKNPIQILKLRLAKLVATNKEKKRLMEQYLRNVKVIEDAFDQIKEATGIQSNEEIVTSFIKAEEQIYALINYVNTLGTETD